LPENVGIAKGANMALDAIFAAGDWDLVIKMDNDCEVQSANILRQLAEVFADTKEFQCKFVLSPRVDGIMRQPKRHSERMLAGRKIGITGIVGGLFHVVPGEVYKAFRYHDGTPRGGYNDSYFCDWFRRIKGGEVGYVEGLVVEHMDGSDGQVANNPIYTKRKMKEMDYDLAHGLGSRTAE
jgi:GT2 family glycosyltransferase